jgi:hypothetical protein
VTDYSQLGFLVRCDASPNGMFRGDESRGYADNLFRANRRIHDIADAMAGRATHGQTRAQDDAPAENGRRRQCEAVTGTGSWPGWKGHRTVHRR